MVPVSRKGDSSRHRIRLLAVQRPVLGGHGDALDIDSDILVEYCELVW